jgi:hypothetical protein
MVIYWANILKNYWLDYILDVDKVSITISITKNLPNKTVQKDIGTIFIVQYWWVLLLRLTSFYLRYEESIE